MDNFDMNDLLECTPPEIEAAAKISSLKLLPEKSKDRYNYTYDQFMKWRKDKGIKTSFSENVLLTYIDELSKNLKPSTLWTQYSMLRSTLYVHHNVDISKYLKLKAYLKRSNDGYVPKKAKVLTPEEINEFLNKAPDNDYLFIKVALVIGISGACRKQELIQLTLDDIQDVGTAAIITLKNTKNKLSRKFTITGNFYAIFKKYVNLRPNFNEKRFFLNYQKSRCTKQVVGINKIGNVPREVAKFLKLQNPNLYTGHCFRRSSATILVDSGEDITTLKRHAGWKSSTVAEGYIEDSISKRMEISHKIVAAVAGPSTATGGPSTVTAASTATVVSLTATGGSPTATEKNILLQGTSDDIRKSEEWRDFNVNDNIQNTLAHNVSQTPINFHNCSNNHFTFNFYGEQGKN